MAPIPKPKSRATEKREKVAARERHKRDVYRAVSLRDAYHCRACGKGGNPCATSMLDVLHHHEIRFRSLGGPITSRNCLLLCAECHADAQAHRLTISGNPDGKLRFKSGKDVWTHYVGSYLRVKP